MVVIPHSRPTLGPEESEAVAGVIKSGMIAQGRKVEEFETAFSTRFDLGNSAAVSSGTAGLHLALLALEVGAGDEVIIPSYVCTALLNAVHHAGANPVIADIDPATFNIDAEDAKRRITRRTRAIIVPHMFGMIADLASLIKTGLPVIEDCAQCVGAAYGDRPVGSDGLLSVYSFYATKVMTTGEGGMVTSRDLRLIDKIKNLRDYDNMPSYHIRYNYKMTDMQAAMGLAQLDKLNSFVAMRRSLSNYYSDFFSSRGGHSMTLPQRSADHIYFRYVVRVDADIEAMIKGLREIGIDCARPVFCPLHRYLQLMTGYPGSEKAWKEAISLPIYPSITDHEKGIVASALLESLHFVSGKESFL